MSVLLWSVSRSSFFLTDEHIQRGVTKKEPDDSREQYTQQKGYEVKDL